MLHLHTKVNLPVYSFIMYQCLQDCCLGDSRFDFHIKYHPFASLDVVRPITFAMFDDADGVWKSSNPQNISVLDHSYLNFKNNMPVTFL